MVANNDFTVISQTPGRTLTLTTCHPKGSARQRLIVRAENGVNRRRMRKLTLGAAAAALLAGSCLVAAGPASAQEQAAFVQWQSPDQDARLSGQALHIKAKVGFHGGVKSWAVEVLAPEEADYPGYGTICERAESRSPAYVNIDCVWDTTAYPNDGGHGPEPPLRRAHLRPGRRPERDVRRRAGSPAPIPTTAVSSSPTRCPRPATSTSPSRNPPSRPRSAGPPTPNPTSPATSSRSASATARGRTSGRPAAR